MVVKEILAKSLTTLAVLITVKIEFIIREELTMNGHRYATIIIE